MPRLAVLAALLLLGACSDPPCEVPPPGPCKADADCVLARCADVGCGAPCGAPVAVSQLEEHRCLVASGAAAPEGCRPVDWHPGFNTCSPRIVHCPSVAAVCREGLCAGAAEGSFPDGGPG